ncbi:hypothetical protein I2I11_14390 [Pontibacter sp. 172403-2]|nr:hypothetical protein [Pontibacter sp. 172403-2]MBF9254489.1 hypothetical protein [Pontibacter sp. 172403-2]
MVDKHIIPEYDFFNAKALAYFLNQSPAAIDEPATAPHFNTFWEALAT